ncbi:MAG: polyprenyl synthetase family protein [Spirochaetales bacterium]|nr:MAG: polyprenyl synthetase family protein [Spirochaetales bacterium]
MRSAALQTMKETKENPTPQARRFNRFAEKYSPRIDLSIEKYFAGKKKDAGHAFMAVIVNDLAEYCLRPGKRLRPLVLIAAYQGYGGNASSLGEILAIASSLELMHSFLLVQDDIIDRSSVRRGGDAFHLLMQRRFAGLTRNSGIGSDVALVAADVLFCDALQLILGAKIDGAARESFLGLFARAYERTAWGQILDIINTRPLALRTGDTAAREIGLMKTAYYTVYYPLLMGCALAGVSLARERRAIGRFALPLGHAFQVRDDILGVFGDKIEMGKSADSDIMEGKKTVLVQNAIELLDAGERKRFAKLFTKPGKTKADIARIRAVMRESGALAAAEEMHRSLIGQAVRAVPSLGINAEGMDLLRGLCAAIGELK